MNETDGRGKEYDARTTYQIRVKGLLDPRWAGRFEGMSLMQTDDGDTVLTGPVTDQAALHGLLRKVRDLGIPLLSVTTVEAEGPGERTGSQHRTSHHSREETQP